MITCYAFRAVPPFAQGLVRDLRVRWALEEVGLPFGAIVLHIAERFPACCPMTRRVVRTRRSGCSPPSTRSRVASSSSPRSVVL